MSIVDTERDFFPLYDIETDPFVNGDYYTIYSRSGHTLIYGAKEENRHLLNRDGGSYKSWKEVYTYLRNIPLPLICERHEAKCPPNVLYSLPWIWLEEAQKKLQELTTVDLIPKPEIWIHTHTGHSVVVINGIGLSLENMTQSQAEKLQQYLEHALGLTTEKPDHQADDHD